MPGIAAPAAPSGRGALSQPTAPADAAIAAEAAAARPGAFAIVAALAMSDAGATAAAATWAPPAKATDHEGAAMDEADDDETEAAIGETGGGKARMCAGASPMAVEAAAAAAEAPAGPAARRTADGGGAALQAAAVAATTAAADMAVEAPHALAAEASLGITVEGPVEAAEAIVPATAAADMAAEGPLCDEGPAEMTEAAAAAGVGGEPSAAVTAASSAAGSAEDRPAPAAAEDAGEHAASVGSGGGVGTGDTDAAGEAEALELAPCSPDAARRQASAGDGGPSPAEPSAAATSLGRRVRLKARVPSRSSSLAFPDPIAAATAPPSTQANPRSPPPTLAPPPPSPGPTPAPASTQAPDLDPPPAPAPAPAATPAAMAASSQQPSISEEGPLRPSSVVPERSSRRKRAATMSLAAFHKRPCGSDAEDAGSPRHRPSGAPANAGMLDRSTCGVGRAWGEGSSTAQAGSQWAVASGPGPAGVWGATSSISTYSAWGAGSLASSSRRGLAAAGEGFAWGSGYGSAGGIQELRFLTDGRLERRMVDGTVQTSETALQPMEACEMWSRLFGSDQKAAFVPDLAGSAWNKILRTAALAHLPRESSSPAVRRRLSASPQWGPRKRTPPPHVPPELLRVVAAACEELLAASQLQSARAAAARSTSAYHLGVCRKEPERPFPDTQERKWLLSSGDAGRLAVAFMASARAYDCEAFRGGLYDDVHQRTMQLLARCTSPDHCSSRFNRHCEEHAWARQGG